MAEAWQSAAGDPDRSNQPFDRAALHATLADALKDVDDTDVPAPEARVEAAPPPPPAPVTGYDENVRTAPRPRPFGSVAAPPAGGAAAPPARSGPSIIGSLGGGAANLSSGGAPLGPSISGFRPGGLGAPGGLAGGGLGGAGLGGAGLGGVRAGLGSAVDAPTEAPATIPLRRPARPEPAEVKAEASEQVHHAPPRAVAAPVPGWTPADDDILPAGAARRRSLRLKR